MRLLKTDNAGICINWYLVVVASCCGHEFYMLHNETVYYKEQNSFVCWGYLGDANLISHKLYSKCVL